MTTISAKVIEDSVSEAGARLTTFQLRYPRWFHSEIMTHRALARNASSSRAIPVEKMLASIEADPAEPWHLGKHEPGMQAKSEITDPNERKAFYALWRQAMRNAVKTTEDLFTLCKPAKQVLNRLTEPFQHIDVVVSATDFDNLFALRCHPDTEPHFRVLAWRMADIIYTGSTPTLRKLGEWHLPYVTAEERNTLPLETLKACSTARCARVSYRLHDGAVTSVAKDLDLHKKLLAGLATDDGEPGHLSPLEHQATPLSDPTSYSGPFKGWKQYRKEFAGENATFDYHKAIEKGWRDLAYSIVTE